MVGKPEVRARKTIPATDLGDHFMATIVITDSCTRHQWMREPRSETMLANRSSHCLKVSPQRLCINYKQWRNLVETFEWANFASPIIGQTDIMCLPVTQCGFKSPMDYPYPKCLTQIQSRENTTQIQIEGRAIKQLAKSLQERTRH